MKKRIHINKQRIAQNVKNGTDEPCITVKTYKSNDYGHRVFIAGESKVVQSMNKPLSCGARVWIETHAPVEIEVDYDDGSTLGHTVR